MSTIIQTLTDSAFQFVKTDCPEELPHGSVCFLDLKLVNDAILSYNPVILDISTSENNSNFGKIVLIGERSLPNIVKSYQFINVGQTININNPNKSIRVYI